MKQTRLLATAVLFLGALLAISGRVEATTPYALRVDRFEFDGNLPGHFVDEFDSPALDPAWFVHNPTAAQSGGILTLSSPGSQSTFKVGNSVAAQEQSDINSSSPGALSVRDGAGDFTETATWLPDLPKFSQQFHMETRHEIAPNVNESVSIGVANFDPAVAAALGFPSVPPGDLTIFFGREAFDVASFDFQAVPLDPADVTGNIMLRLTFDDAKNEFTGNFSLDGKSFQGSRPFTPVSFGPGDPAFGVGLHALSLQVVPEPTTLVLCGCGLVALAVFGRRRLLRGPLRAPATPPKLTPAV